MVGRVVRHGLEIQVLEEAWVQHSPPPEGLPTDETHQLPPPRVFCGEQPPSSRPLPRPHAELTTLNVCLQANKKRGAQGLGSCFRRVIHTSLSITTREKE